MEFAEHGNLLDFLRTHADRNDGYERPNTVRPLISEKQLISFARQVSLSICWGDGWDLYPRLAQYIIVEFAEHGNLRGFLRKHADRNDGYERQTTVRPLISGIVPWST